MVAATSIQAYRGARADGTLGRQEAQVLAAVQPGGNYSLQELCRLTGLPINAVSGRCADLKKSGHLESGDKRPCTVTGRLISPVRRPKLQRELFQ